jgi:hypothetical protein
MLQTSSLSRKSRSIGDWPSSWTRILRRLCLRCTSLGRQVNRCRPSRRISEVSMNLLRARNADLLHLLIFQHFIAIVVECGINWSRRYASYRINTASARASEVRMLIPETVCTTSDLLCEERFDRIVGRVRSEESRNSAITALELVISQLLLDCGILAVLTPSSPISA